MFKPKIHKPLDRRTENLKVVAMVAVTFGLLFVLIQLVSKEIGRQVCLNTSASYSVEKGLNCEEYQ